MEENIVKINKNNIVKKGNLIVEDIYNKFSNNNLISILGKASTGKTTLLVKLIKYIKDNNILLISLDSNRDILNKKFKEYLDLSIDKDNLYLVYDNCSIDDINNKVNNYNIEYILIDYLELLTCSNNRDELIKLLDTLKSKNKKILLLSVLDKDMKIKDDIKEVSDTIYYIEDVK